MKKNIGVFLQKFAWIALCVIVVVSFACLFLPRCRQLTALNRRRLELETHNSALQRAIAELKWKQERFLSDPDFVEHVAREAGRIKSDEILFKFTNRTFTGSAIR